MEINCNMNSVRMRLWMSTRQRKVGPKVDKGEWSHFLPIPYADILYDGSSCCAIVSVAAGRSCYSCRR